MHDTETSIQECQIEYSHKQAWTCRKLFNGDEKLASGKPATPELESSVMGAESVGKEAKDEFIEERLKKDQKFFEPSRRQRLKTFADMGGKQLL